MNTGDSGELPPPVSLGALGPTGGRPAAEMDDAPPAPQLTAQASAAATAAEAATATTTAEETTAPTAADATAVAVGSVEMAPSAAVAQADPAPVSAAPTSASTATVKPETARAEAAFWGGDPDGSPSSADSSRTSRWSGFDWRDVAIVFGLFVVAFLLRTANMNFDQGQHQHPDERFWSFVLNDVEWPDSVGQYLSSSESPLNPYNPIKEDGSGYPTFSYGTMPLYATKAAAQWMSGGGDGEGLGRTATGVLNGLGIDLRNDDGNDMFNDRYDANLIGRLLSAFIDALTVVLVFFLGRSLGDRSSGILAAVLQTFAVLHIQYAHFLGAEPWVAFFATATVLGAVRIARGRAGIGTWVLTGIVAGLAVASKLSGLPAIIAPLTAVAVLVVTRGLAARRSPVGERNLTGVVTPLLGMATALVVGFLVFRVTLPYAFSDGLNLSLGGLIERDWGRALGLDERYTNDMAYIRDVNTGGSFNWVIQWAGRTPLLFPMVQLFNWGMGPALALACAVGIAYACWRVIRDRQFVFLVPLSVIAVFVAFVALQFNPLNRYLLPAYPSAIALAGFGLVQLWRSVRPEVSWLPDSLFTFWRPIARSAVALMVGFTVLYGFAFVNGVYGNTYTRVAASEWLNENIPDGSKISSQAWDDALPLTLPSTGGWWERFEVVQFDPFFPDSTTKVNQLVQQLDEVDFIVEASNKLYGAIPQMPAKFPATVAYYDALFDGSLGFEKVTEFTSPPSLFGIQFDDRWAEETFTVYDHPPVTVWQKTDDFSTENAYRILDVWRADSAIDHQPREAAANALQLSPEEYVIQQSGGTWNETFSDGFVTNVPWFWWLLWIQVASFALLPISTWLFRALPDRGYGLSKVLGFLSVGMITWMLVSWGVFRFTDWLVWLILLALVAVGAFTAVRSDFDDVARDRLRSWIAAELLFLGVFFFVVILRYWNPDLWHPYRGGEKPMELSYLTAITKSSILPAYDPWFAGGFLNYYYVGWFFLAVPSKALHMPPDLTFNLGLATYAGLAASVVHSIVSNLAGIAKAASVGGPRRPVLKAGLLGVALFMLVGNFDGLRNTINQLRGINQWTAGKGSFGGSIIETIGGIWEWAFGDASLAPFDWWAPSRVNKGTGDITEFPAWSFLFADLHPHLMDMVFFGLLLALALTFVFTLAPRVVSEVDGPDDPMSSQMPGLVDAAADAGIARETAMIDGAAGTTATAVTATLAADTEQQTVLTAGGTGEYGRARTWALAAAMGAVIAVVRMVHTWDWPTVLIVGAASIMLGWFVAERPAGWRAAAEAVGHLVIMALSYVIFSATYVSNNEVFSSGFEFRTPSDTNMDDFLIHWLLFLFAAVIYGFRRMRQLGGAILANRISTVLFVVSPLAFALMHLRVGSVAGWATLGLLLALVLTFAELGESPRSIPHVATSGFFALGFGIIAGVELVSLAGDSQGFNTIFKFWLQVWQLFAIAGAFGIWWVLHSGKAAIHARQREDRSVGLRRIGQFAMLAALAGLLVGALVFPYRGIRARVDDRFETAKAESPLSLDGFSWLDDENTVGLWDVQDVALQQDAGIIEWLRENVEGSPTIVEAWGPGYQWFNRIPMTTGLPSVLGWDWHQRQQRACTAPADFCSSSGFGRNIDLRKEAIQRFYTLPDERIAERFLLTYDVKYVIVGSVENANRRANNEVVEPVMAESVRVMLDAMDGLTTVYENGTARIYEVDHDRIGENLYTAEAVRSLVG